MKDVLDAWCSRGRWAVEENLQQADELAAASTPTNPPQPTSSSPGLLPCSGRRWWRNDPNWSLLKGAGLRDDGARTWTAPQPNREEFPLGLPERQALEAFITWHRQTLLWKVAGLTGRQLASHAIPTTNVTLLGIVRHMAAAERHWWRHRVAGEDVPELYPDDDAWNQLDPDHAAEDYEQLLDEWTAVDTVAARYGLDHTFDRRGETWTVRTLYLHLIEEWARHNGHADLIREAIDGATGE